MSEISVMKSTLPISILLTVTAFLVPCTTLAPAAANSCNRTCGAWDLPFPFGVSSTCQIQLNCTPNATVLAAGGFPVLSITGDTILISLPPVCGRPLEALRRLFTRNYAPNFLNAVLLRNCSGAAAACSIPTTAVRADFKLIDCGERNDSISCYSQTAETPFIDYEKLRRSGCGSLFSAISMDFYGVSSSVSLDVQMVRLGWWLVGDCRCDENAICVRVSPPVGRSLSGYRCQCSEGFAGDGFLDGLGCRRGSGGKTRVGVLIGGVAAGASFIVLTCGLLLCFINTRRSKSKSRSRKNEQTWDKTGITIPLYTYKEMEKATNSFSDLRLLGNGAHGTVYSATLPTGETVAVKKIRQQTDADNTEQVINEIKLLSSANHPNLVKLLGCSIGNDQHILVYEFMPNGTLSQHLHTDPNGNYPKIPWTVRLTIAIETAQAISYLHNDMNTPVYHRDVKSSNILLDYDYRSKVSDFGISRLGSIERSHVSTAPQGTPGYLDPQYHRDFHLSDKSDVYSFGVVLVEIITGMRVVDFNRPPEEVNLAALAAERIGAGRLEEIIDPYIDDGDYWTVRKVGELALRCLALEREMRPSMMEVAAELEEIRLSKSASENYVGDINKY